MEASAPGERRRLAAVRVSGKESKGAVIEPRAAGVNHGALDDADSDVSIVVAADGTDKTCPARAGKRALLSVSERRLCAAGGVVQARGHFDEGDEIAEKLGLAAPLFLDVAEFSQQ
jgi:hypothetical protein